MTDKNPLAHYSGVLSEAVQESAAADVPASGAAALSEYLKDCEQHSVVPDVGGAFAFAFAAGFNLATPQAASEGDYLEGVNIPNLREALIFLGRENGAGQGEVGDKLAQYVNSVVSGVLSKKATLRETPQAAPAAVAVPDDRAAFERELIDNHHYVPSDFSFKDGFYGGDDDYIQFGWDVWKARAALAATPAAVEAPATERMMQLVDAWFSQMKSGNVISQGMARQRIVMFVDTLAATPAAWAKPVSELLGHISDVLPDNAFDKIDTKKWNAVSALVGAATPAAAAPVVLSEPDAIISEVMGLVESYADAVASEMELQYEALEISIKSKLRALLAGVSAPAAQAEQPIATVTRFHDLGGEIDWTGRAIAQVGAKLYLAPQAQADARDADGDAFRTAARLGLTLRFYGNCAQSGMPGAPSVYEVTPGPNNAEAMRASIARADAAIAAQAAQQGDAA